MVNGKNTASQAVTPTTHLKIQQLKRCIGFQCFAESSRTSILGRIKPQTQFFQCIVGL